MYLVAPETVDWEITGRCNLDCVHCNVVKGGSEFADELSFDKLRQIADQLAEVRVFRVSISGGEPLLHPDIFDLLQYLVGLQFSPLLLSNGLLLNNNTIERLRSIGVKKVQISLDGSCSEIYRKLRGTKAGFEKVVTNAKAAALAGIEVNINTVVTRHNVTDIPAILDLCLSIPANCFRVCSFVPTSPEVRSLQIERHELAALTAFLTRKEKELRNRLQIYTPTPKFVHPEDSSALLAKISTSNDLICEAGTILCTILPNGDLVPCTYFRERQFRAGNLFQHTMYEIWERSPVLGSFRCLGKLPKACRACSIGNKCHGGCRAMAYFAAGDMRAVDPRCWLALATNQ